MTILAGDREHSIHLDGQAQNPGLPSLCECISRSYSQARWLYELPGMATDPESEEWTDGFRTIRIPHKHLGIGISTSRQDPRTKLRARGFHTFDTIPRLNSTVARTKFSCLILGSADTADTLLLSAY